MAEEHVLHLFLTHSAKVGILKFPTFKALIGNILWCRKTTRFISWQEITNG